MSGLAAAERERRRDRFRLTTFGLDVECDWPLAGSVPVAAEDDAPATTVEVVAGEEFRAAWAGPGERIFEPPFADGRTRFTVDRGREHFQLWLEDFGRYLVSTDGTWVGCEQDAAPGDIQERFVFAQALPIAAVLQGFEVLHAGAVCGPAGAAAFLGPSGSGKTTITGRLVLRGASFMTDDVLSLATSGPDAVAHPGPPFMAIRTEDVWMVGEEQVGRAIGSSDKLHVTRRVPDEPVPLRVLYYLARGDGCQITRLGEDARRAILGQAFVPYLTTPERLLRHLQIGQLVNDRVEQFRLQTPRDGLDAETLDAIEAHLRERDAW
ncbi:MAG TPA: hypothetical protein VG325_20135 [Solirubrobacteraceae bacterium]|nr:hypothetical protein [Solirubrobacteraceae bacterium]